MTCPWGVESDFDESHSGAESREVSVVKTKNTRPLTKACSSVNPVAATCVTMTVSRNPRPPTERGSAAATEERKKTKIRGDKWNGMAMLLMMRM